MRDRREILKEAKLLRRTMLSAEIHESPGTAAGGFLAIKRRRLAKLEKQLAQRPRRTKAPR